jgi:ATP-dependent 26S proteasome regulatory subunit
VSQVSHEANARFLDALVAWARALLDHAIRARASGDDAPPTPDAEARHARALEDVRALPGIPYVQLARRLGLRELDQLLVCLCLARAVDATVRDLLARLHGDGADGEVTADAACRLFLRGDLELALFLRQSLAGRSLLVTERVIERLPATGAGVALRQPIRLTAAAAELLLGGTVDGSPYFSVVESPGADRPPRAVVSLEIRERARNALRDYHVGAARAPALFHDAAGRLLPPALLLFGPAGAGKTVLALDLMLEIFPAVIHVDCGALVAVDPTPILRRVLDAAALHQAAILLDDAHHVFRGGAAPRLLRALLLETPACAVFTSETADLDARLGELLLLRLELDAPASELRACMWDTMLPLELRGASDVDFNVLAERYRFDGRAIAAASRLALAQLAGSTDEPATLRMHDLDDIAQLMLTSQMGSLARRLGGRFTFDDIVLPDEQRRQLQDIVDAGHSWDVVMSSWGFADRLPSGKSLTALFWGKPGTGKSFAARIIAHLLGKRLFAVNLDQILSKWLGETEKNIRAIFTAASSSGAVLLFDEADSLFGARVNAESSQDRSNNMMTNLLLQEIDEYTGIVVLTTNLKENIDEAFKRRLLFEVEFPFPDEELRAKIWKTLLPAQAPVAPGVDFAALARRFEMSGGEIKKVLVRAAMRAHAQGARISHGLLLETCAEEYAIGGRVIQG